MLVSTPFRPSSLMSTDYHYVSSSSPPHIHHICITKAFISLYATPLIAVPQLPSTRLHNYSTTAHFHSCLPPFRASPSPLLVLPLTPLRVTTSPPICYHYSSIISLHYQYLFCIFPFLRLFLFTPSYFTISIINTSHHHFIVTPPFFLSYFPSYFFFSFSVFLTSTSLYYSHHHRTLLSFLHHHPVLLSFLPRPAFTVITPQCHSSNTSILFQHSFLSLALNIYLSYFLNLQHHRHCQNNHTLQFHYSNKTTIP